MLHLGVVPFPVTNAQAFDRALRQKPDDDLSRPIVTVMAACGRCAERGEVKRLMLDAKKVPKLYDQPGTQRFFYDLVTDARCREVVFGMLYANALHVGGIMVRRALRIDTAAWQRAIVLMEPQPAPEGALDFRQVVLAYFVARTQDANQAVALLNSLSRALARARRGRGHVQVCGPPHEAFRVSHLHVYVEDLLGFHAHWELEAISPADVPPFQQIPSLEPDDMIEGAS